MRKKLIITNVIMVFISLSCLLLISISVISRTNYKRAEKEIETYLDLTTSYFDGTNGKEVIDTFGKATSTLRITIIDLDGKVLFDTFNEEFNSHLDREEIKNLGTTVERYSTSLNRNMLYLACKDNGVYVRVSMAIDDINPIFDSYVNVSLLSLILIVLVSTIIMWPINKKELEPLVDVTNKLNMLTNQPAVKSSNSIEDIYHEIEHVAEIINEQMLEINFEKERVKCIIDNLNQGLLVIDSKQNIELINNYAKELFDVKLEYQGNNYLFIIRNIDLQKSIEEAISSHISEKEIKMNGKIYHITFSFFDDKMIVIINDITKEKNLSDMKKEFFQNASHELKSPLTSILGYQQMIEDEIIVDEAEKKEAISKTIKEAKRMRQIIVEMLELSKLESKIDYDITSVEVNDVIDEVLYLFEPNIKEKNITVEKGDIDLVLQANSEHIYMLIKNIIENAIKYNKENGKIIISFNDKVLSITDTGIGINENDIQRIFERFYRVDKAKSKETGGTGLGLAIVKHICNTYGYSISVKSVMNVKTSFEIKVD